ncbi:efflux RND transporter periplasmic adaptor subunit [Mangrovibacterium lignilyticum]|uniref:efflux RND transporter periplasmic adaptor subunit n=1 Tax=Mangrovibacterium lignilyticum TaxID=2668052 RepID=UPI0013D4D0B8|nr:efflux RND transporter periplasmic adaptor subunit [Mangrovibacterium lignilyticum]
MSWRKITFIVAALIILLGGSAALSRVFINMKPDPPRRPGDGAKRFVKAEAVAYTDIVSPLRREGRVVASHDVLLVAEAAGKIEMGEVPIKKGRSFKKGQLLATIYKDEAELALKARKSNFLNLISNILPDLKIDYPDEFQTYYDYFNKIKFDQPLPVMPAPKSEKLRVFLASRTFISEYFGLLQDEKNLARRSLIAPFDGTFSQVNYEVGAYVNAGSQIARMIGTEVLDIEVPVENHNSKWIKIGDKVKVLSRNNGDTLDGRVVRKADFVDAATQSRSIFVRVQQFHDDDLLAGEYKVVEFPGQRIARAMEIPRSAVFNSNVVFTVVDGELKKDEINILKVNETSLIFNGLPEGKMVVTEPLINVKENLPVEILAGANSQKAGK